MATRKQVPREDGGGSLGKASKKWGALHAYVTVDPAISDSSASTGTYIQMLSWLVKEIKAIKGNVTNWFDTAAVSLSAIWTETAVFSPAIPSGATGFSFRAGRNATVNYLYIDCQDLAGDAQTPTSFVLTIYINDTLAYTSAAITTAATTDTVSLSISAGDRVKVSVSNTTGITGCIVVGMRKVRRAA